VVTNGHQGAAEGVGRQARLQAWPEHLDGDPIAGIEMRSNLEEDRFKRVDYCRFQGGESGDFGGRL
jgi:hypothetical protein